jgi:glutamine synthetase
LAFAAMLAAGLDGIEKGMELGPESSDNIFEMTPAEREAAGIGSLPGDLNEAIKEFEKSSFVREALGDHVCDYLIRNKVAEWDEYKMLITPYELQRYLPIL